MADTHTRDGRGEEKRHTDSSHEPSSEPNGIGKHAEARASTSAKCAARATREYCEELRAWMWQYYAGYVTWQSWLAATALPCPFFLQPGSGLAATTPLVHSQNWSGQVGHTLLPHPTAATSQSSLPGEAAGGAGHPAQQPVQQENGNAPRAGECCCCCQTIGITFRIDATIVSRVAAISPSIPIT